MAEFTEVMKQAHRMCESVVECCDCALNKFEDCPLTLFADKIKIEQLAEVEHIVMDWAKEHPEPRYLEERLDALKERVENDDE